MSFADRSAVGGAAVPGPAFISPPHPARRPAEAGRRLCRILMTADAVGGVWRYSVDLAAALRARGVHTTLAVMGPAPSPAQLREAGRLGAAVEHRPYRLEWMEDCWDDVASAGAWLLDLERRLRPDVVHLNGYAHAALPWSAPAVVVAHSCVRSWWRAVKSEDAPAFLDAYSRAVRAGLACARRVVAPTAAMRAALELEYGRGARVDVIPNGAACAATAAAAVAVAGKEPFVFAAGRVWDAAKNLLALSAVAHELPWPVYVAGDACEPGESNGAGLPAVRALGRLAPEEMSRWYARAAIYALPARYEPFGLSVLEAAAAGCALVLGDIPSLRENWEGAALFVAPDDRDGLASAIRALTTDAGRRCALGRAAVERASRLTVDRTAEGYLRLYEELLG